MEQFILDILKGYGLAGVVILGLGWTVLVLVRRIDRINEARLRERDILFKTIENNTASAKDQAIAIADRNKVTEDLGKSFERLALVHELFMQKADMHDEGFKEKLQEYKLVIDSIPML